MRKTIGLIVASLALCSLAACSSLNSALGTQETTASNIPSAATLKLKCSNGYAQTPPIRAGACDDYNVANTGCVALAQNPMTAGGAVAGCGALGYSLTGQWTPL